MPAAPVIRRGDAFFVPGTLGGGAFGAVTDVAPNGTAVCALQSGAVFAVSPEAVATLRVALDRYLNAGAS